MLKHILFGVSAEQQFITAGLSENTHLLLLYSLLQEHRGTSPLQPFVLLLWAGRPGQAWEQNSTGGSQEGKKGVWEGGALLEIRMDWGKPGGFSGTMHGVGVEEKENSASTEKELLQSSGKMIVPLQALSSVH